jgi:glycosyltransferase involved in cell wall biosynthesis
MNAGASRPPAAVTVAIPTVGRPRLLATALHSVLAQAGVDLQVVVSDNAAEEDLRACIPELADRRVHLQRHETRLSMTENWNSCLEAAHGEFFLLLSDDDMLAPGALAALLAVLPRARGGAHRETGLVYGRTSIVDESGRRLWTSLEGVADEPADVFAGALASHRRALYLCSTMLRTSALREAGGYDGARFGPAADLGASLSVAFACGRVGYTEAVVSSYTEHTASSTSALSVREWTQAIAAIGDLLRQNCDAGGVLRERDIREFVAYGVMDVVRATTPPAEQGILKTWARAERTRREAGLPPSVRASGRLCAKLVYLRGGDLLSRARRHAASVREPSA